MVVEAVDGVIEGTTAGLAAVSALLARTPFGRIVLALIVLCEAGEMATQPPEADGRDRNRGAHQALPGRWPRR